MITLLIRSSINLSQFTDVFAPFQFAEQVNMNSIAEVFWLM